LDFFLFFIGLSGIVTGAAVYLGLLTADWLQWTVFAVLALMLLLSLRKRMHHHLQASSPGMAEELHGERVKLLEDIAPGQTGKGEARGSSWSVRNETSVTLGAGTISTVSIREGLTLVVKD
jgi:membrane protein implicated in regulation of membrane protease activity